MRKTAAQGAGAQSAKEVSRHRTERVFTAEMIADSLIKALSEQKHHNFIRSMSMDDITRVLRQQKRLEELRSCVKARRTQGETPNGETVNATIIASGTAKARRDWNDKVASW